VWDTTESSRVEFQAWSQRSTKGHEMTRIMKFFARLLCFLTLHAGCPQEDPALLVHGVQETLEMKMLNVKALV
jgi:hypothetical protein